MQQDWRRFTDEEVGVDAIEAVAGRRDITGAVETVDTTVTLAVVEAAGAVAEAMGRRGATEAKAGVRSCVTVAETGEAAADAVAVADVTGGEEVGVAAAC